MTDKLEEQVADYLTAWKDTIVRNCSATTPQEAADDLLPFIRPAIEREERKKIGEWLETKRVNPVEGGNTFLYDLTDEEVDSLRAGGLPK